MIIIERRIALVRQMRGVTLMELLIVMVIIGILAAVAYPSYREYSLRAKRNEARAPLLQIATQQERFYLQNSTYTQDMTRLGFTAAGNLVTDTKSYRINVDAADANNYTATATYIGPSAKEQGRCLTYQIDGRGVKTSAPDADCWSKTR